MRLISYTLVDNSPDPVTGVQLSPRDRLAHVVDQARWAEQLGFDAYGVGERHAQRFLSSSPPVLLSYVAARTERIRLLTTVTVLSLLDPVRVAEDYATLDQLSGGRLEIIIGKGNDPEQNALFGYDLDEQWERNREKYELLRRLLREERVTWSGRFRPDLVEATTQPRPLQQPGIPVWHGSASSTESTELAARFGEPLFSANGFHPMRTYAALIDHYRERFAAHGHDPADAVVGAGFIALVVAPRSQDARRAYEPAFRAFLDSPGARHNRLPFRTLEEFLEQGSALVGSPEEVLDKIGRYREAFGHELTGVPLEVPGVPEPVIRRGAELFVAEVVPALRRSFPSRVWSDRAA
ncbi:alkanesulfonate monooxygenase SsuD/methylene tetrahydromethanopterin reductase-like flavin-dependent oxidoreductase (luciferase family) [Barrientosiimonas humi]|uniref:Alkanesulfonate monooxygenase SsuD/methylene tetrahydromethanopterin reductase-like flavin-dependent oxidoreductase (Luciferase family) n=1 Tax=Barrientosiimonas humi TaxID=999931 RepID=A0A542XEK4_9MICO|nr:LLM class flavin-dependent oxidoreductase [Barrientosiimonas humi]TQL34261.1 alkanesulfonate monooxygenase SsuD/methylene tetrahydromethanopterin reductase-like flavin-dependent oxidoreductase (luciferase family) [Barrientosiimonas humi]CAG7574253.1 Alkanal monooxygenase alpha chain [Barrientosiimonas humi]